MRVLEQSERCPSYHYEEGRLAAADNSPQDESRGEAWNNGWKDFHRETTDDYGPDDPNPNNSDGLSDNQLKERMGREFMEDNSVWI